MKTKNLSLRRLLVLAVLAGFAVTATGCGGGGHGGCGAYGNPKAPVTHNSETITQ